MIYDVFLIMQNFHFWKYNPDDEVKLSIHLDCRSSSFVILIALFISWFMKRLQMKSFNIYIYS